MSDEDKKKKTPPEINRGPQTYALGGTAHVSFFDVDTGAALYPEDGAEIEFQAADGSKIDPPARLVKKGNSYTFALPSSVPPAQPTPVEDLETPCDVPSAAEASLLVISSSKPFTIQCRPWSLLRVALAVPAHQVGGTTTAPGEPDTNSSTDDSAPQRSKDKSQPEAKEGPCSVPLPLMRMEESYSAKFRAFDACFKDYLSNPKAVVNEVEVRATAVRTQAGGSSGRFRPHAVAGKTVDGFLELSGLLPQLLYKFDVIAPRGYFCVQPPQPYFVNPSTQSAPIVALFQPFDEFPVRSVIVAQKGAGLRAAKLQFRAGGQQVCTDEFGTWNIPAGTTGRIDFQLAGKVFCPDHIKVDKHSPLAFVVEVGDQQVAQSGSGKQRFQFLDKEGKPFANRELEIVSPEGRRERVRTEEDGGFWADEGWVARADDDEHGYASEQTLLLTSIS
jgi:hypothetical protein